MEIILVWPVTCEHQWMTAVRFPPALWPPPSPDFNQTPYLPPPPPRLPQYHSPELYLWLPQCPIKTSRQNPTINQQWQLGNSQRKTTHDIFYHSTYKITIPQCLISLALNCQWPYHHPMILKKKQDIGNTKLLSLKYWGDRIVVQVFYVFYLLDTWAVASDPHWHPPLPVVTGWQSTKKSNWWITERLTCEITGLITENILHF